MHSFRSSIKLTQSALRWLFRPVVKCAVRHGMGYTQCIRLIKPLFLYEARSLLQEQSRNLTDSAVVLTAGVHREDLKHLKEEDAWFDSIAEPSIPLPQQVLASWLMNGLPSSIPFKTIGSEADEPLQILSFSDLIRLTPKVAAQSMSARLLLQDMCSKGMLTVANNMVTIQPMGSRAPNFECDPGLKDLSATLSDLMSTGMRNLEVKPELRFLEQSILVDGLRPESAHSMHEHAQDAWQKTVSALLPAAKAASDHDEPLGGHMRMRIGMYFYAEPMLQVAKPTDRDLKIDL